MVTINRQAALIAGIAEKTIRIRYIKRQQGVRGRNSGNRLVQEKPGWARSRSPRDGIISTCRWIERMVMGNYQLEVAE
jgi:hypothetical protein